MIRHSLSKRSEANIIYEWCCEFIDEYSKGFVIIDMVKPVTPLLVELVCEFSQPQPIGERLPDPLSAGVLSMSDLIPPLNAGEAQSS